MVNMPNMPNKFQTLFDNRHRKDYSLIYEKFKDFCKETSCFETIAFLEELDSIRADALVLPSLMIHKRCNSLYNQGFHIDKVKDKPEGVESNINVDYKVKENIRALVRNSWKKKKKEGRLLIPSDFDKVHDNLVFLCEQDIYVRFQDRMQFTEKKKK